MCCARGHVRALRRLAWFWLELLLPIRSRACTNCRACARARKERVGAKSADSQFEVFCFNPNEDIGTIAGRKGWDAAKQERKWLQVYNSVVYEAQQKNKRTGCGMFSALCCGASVCKGTTGTVHVVWNRSNGDPPQSTEEAVEAARDDHPALVRSRASDCFARRSVQLTRATVGRS